MNSKVFKFRCVQFFLIILLLFAGRAYSQLDFSPAERIIESIQKTAFPADTVRVTDFGARGDGVADDRQAIIDAIDACSKSGGGVVSLTKGEYFSQGPLSLKSNVNLHLAKGATLRFSAEPADFIPPVFTRWEGVEIYNYSPMIYTVNQENIAITGAGTIDGGGREKWVPFRSQQWEARSRVHIMSDEQTPVYERVFGEGDFLRNSFIQMIHCQRILIEGITLVNSPFWMFHPVYSTDIIVRNVTFNSLIINNDGTAFDSCSRGLVEGCTFSAGDDAVVFKSGRDRDGWRVNRPTKDIVVRNCSAPQVLHGVAFGSEMSGGIENVYVENFKMGKVESQAIQFKANKDRGSYIRDIFIRNVEVDSVGSHLIYFTNSYHTYRGGDAPTAFHDIYLENIQCNHANNVIQLQGLEEMPLHDIYIDRVSVKSAERVFSRKEFIRDVFLKDVYVEGSKIELTE